MSPPQLRTQAPFIDMKIKGIAAQIHHNSLSMLVFGTRSNRVARIFVTIQLHEFILRYVSIGGATFAQYARSTAAAGG